MQVLFSKHFLTSACTFGKRLQRASHSGRSGTLRHTRLGTGSTTTNEAFLRYHQTAEGALTQKDRSGNDADALQKARYIIRSRWAFVSLLFLFAHFFSNNERIWKNLRIAQRETQIILAGRSQFVSKSRFLVGTLHHITLTGSVGVSPTLVNQDFQANARCCRADEMEVAHRGKRHLHALARLQDEAGRSELGRGISHGLTAGVGAGAEDLAKRGGRIGQTNGITRNNFQECWLSPQARWTPVEHWLGSPVPKRPEDPQRTG